LLRFLPMDTATYSELAKNLAQTVGRFVRNARQQEKVASVITSVCQMKNVTEDLCGLDVSKSEMADEACQAPTFYRTFLLEQFEGSPFSKKFAVFFFYLNSGFSRSCLSQERNVPDTQNPAAIAAPTLRDHKT